MSNVLVAGLSFIVSFLLYPLFIKLLNQRQHQQIVSEYSLDSFKAKAKTPSLGGVLFVLVPVLVFMMVFPKALLKAEVLLVLLVYLTYGLIGFADDYKIILEKNNKGISARLKFFLQLVLAAVFYFFFRQYLSSSITIYGLSWSFDLGILYLAFVLFVFTGASNAVNLTDGLDGLAIMPIVLVAAGLGVFAYLAGDLRFANYLHLPYVKYSSELVVICAAMIGAGLAFLWYNAHPAQVFMGDVGALSLGAMLGTIAVMVRQEIVFAIMGGVFVVEAISVFLQIGSLRMRNKRVFLMAPLHHHYEKKGWRETQVVIRFWIITIMLVVLGLMTLKLR